MIFSRKSYSILYFMVFLSIFFFVICGLPTYSGLDDVRSDVNIAFGQINNGQNDKNGDRLNTTIDSAIDGNNVMIANNGSSTSNSMKFSFSGTDSSGAKANSFECSMDGKAFVTCISTNTVNVANGVHTFSVRFKDNTGHQDSTPASFRWTVGNLTQTQTPPTQTQTTPKQTQTPPTQTQTTPTLVISNISAEDGNNSRVSNNGYSQSASIKFTFGSNDTTVVGKNHFECNIDNSKYVTCTSPFVFQNLIKDGKHTFNVRAEDLIGNKSSSPTSFTWNVDTVSPTTTIDAAVDAKKAPIANGSNSNSNSMEIKFSGNDTAGNESKGAGISRFECNIDNSKYVTCTSPFVFQNVKDGIHTFTVFSIDKARNKDATPASLTWTADTLAPHISIDTAADGNGKLITSGSNTSSNSVTFAFSGNDTGGKEGKGVGIKQFECSLDGASFSICTSPVRFTSVNLPEGAHTFEIVAEDNIGNINSSPESFAWTIDSEPPTTKIDSATDGHKTNVSNGSNTSSNSVIFSFSGVDRGGRESNGVGIKKFECKIDNSDFAPCTRPIEYTNLPDGSHRLQVLSEDNVGNISPAPTSFDWTVDTLAPDTTITSVVDSNATTIENNSNIKSDSMQFNFTGKDNGGKESKGFGIKKYDCSIDSSKYTTCTSPVQLTAVNMTDGTHIFKVLSEDGVGNKDRTPASFNWTLDTVPPTASIKSAIDGNKSTITNGSSTKSKSITFRFSGNDTKGVGINHFECSMDSSNFTICTSPIEFNSASLADGRHTFRVLSVDNSTNRDTSPASLTWTVDSVPPQTAILSVIDGNGTRISAGENTSSNLAKVTFIGNDTGGAGIKKLECSLDGASFAVCTSPVQLTPANLTDRTHIFKVISEDKSANKDPSPALFNWTVDTVPPITAINTVADGNNSSMSNGSSTKSKSITIGFSGNDTGGVGVEQLECSLDGASFNVCTSPIQLNPTNLIDGAHTFMVTAQDKVGNMAKTPALFNWTVDTLPPITTIDTVTDSNKSAVSNDGITNSTSLAFTFSGSDNGVGIDNYECGLDNSTFAACTSPVQYRNLTNGIHGFQLVAEDKVGNKGSTPSSFNWTTDTQPPSTSIFLAKDGDNKTMVPDSNTTSNSITFEFSANDTGGGDDKGVGIKQYECSLDKSNFSTCSSPVKFSSSYLKDGSHAFKIRAEDNAGNMNPTPASFSWKIDSIPPTTTIKSAIDGNKSTITNGSSTKFKSVTLSFSGNDSGTGISNFECSLDNSNFTACVSPIQSVNLTDGGHIFKVTAKDNAGNTNPSPELFSWTVDTVAPLTTIDSTIDGNKSAVNTGGNTSSNSLTFAFSGTDTGVGLSHFECSIDDSNPVTCTSPLKIDSLRDGIHTLVTSAHDKVGNKDLSPSSFSWTVDTVAPLTTINSAFDGNKSEIRSGGNTSSNNAVVIFSAKDTGGVENKGVGINHFECSIDNSNYVSCTSPLGINSLSEGLHNLRIFSKDNVGNMRSHPASINWTVDTMPPMTSISSAIDGNNKTLNNKDNSSSTSIEFTMKGNDNGGVGVNHIECSLDGGPFAECTSPIEYSSSNISDGVHIFDARAVDNVGNKDLSPSQFTWTVDTVPPDANINSATDGNGTKIDTGGNTSSNSMTFNFSGIDTGGKEGNGVGIKYFECSLDNSNFTLCNSPVHTVKMIDGPHILDIRAQDNVGNISPSPSSFPWTVDTKPPTTNIDSATDGSKTTVTNGGDTKSTSITILFSGNDTGVGVGKFECSLDNSNFTACTSPVQSVNLTDGPHVFEIRAQDKVGNTGVSPSSFRWTVDTTAPDTIIDSATDSHAKKIAIGGNSSSNSITLAFSGNDTGVGINHFECSIDSSNPVTCTSPIEFNSIRDGLHSISVRAEDNSTNKDLTPALLNWTVDTSPPTTTINSVEDVNQSSLSNGASTKSTSVVVAFSGTDAGGVGIERYQCSIDNSNFVTCTSPVKFSNLKDGVHILHLRAVDNVGNTGPSPSSSFIWTVDTTPPATSINSATNGNNSVVTNGGITKSTSMTFAFSGTDTGGVDHFECSVDKSNFTICTSPIQFTSVNLGEGTHTFRVLAEDNSTNKDPTPASFTWTIDTVPPNTTLVSAIDGNRTSLRTGDNTSSNSITFAFTANDTGGNNGKGVGINHFECSIDNSKYATCTSPYAFTKGLKDGNHTFNVLSVDNSRNKDATPSSFTWAVDTTPPATSINFATDGNKTAVPNGGSTKSTSMTFGFSGNDTGGVGIDLFECNVNGLTFVTCTSPFTFPSLSEDGQYTLEVRAQDRVGNKDPSPATWTWTVDTSPPTTAIDSATDGNNKAITAGGNTSSNSMVLQFSTIDNGVGVDHSECSIDNSSFAVCTSPIQFTPKKLSDGIHIVKIRSEDKVGNRGTIPALFNWTVDTTAPNTKIDSATDGNKSAIHNGGSTKSTLMTFAFSGNDTGGLGIDHFGCSIDKSEFVTCTSPFTSSKSLKDGNHTFRVLSEDKVGNKDLTPASYNWTVDTAAPSTKIDSATDGNKSTIANDGYTKSTSMTFTFSGNDTGGVGIGHFSCSIDKSESVTCTSPYKIPRSLTDGAHIFSVISEDKVGNKDPTPASLGWTVDTVAPSTRIDSATDGNKSTLINGGNSSSNSAIITFSGLDGGGNTGNGVGINHFECSLDGSSYSNCSTPLKINKLKDGTHTVEMRASDNVGNKDPTPASLSWTVDTAAPSTTISSAIDGKRNIVAPGGNSTSTSMIFTLSGNDTGVGLDHFECSLDGVSFTLCTSPVELKNLADGAHRLEVQSKDKVGNVDATPASFAWRIDTTPPTTSIGSAVDGNKTAISNNSSTRSNSITFNFSGQDTGKVEVKRFECSLDNSEFASCTNPYSFHKLADGTHTFKVRAVDSSGNRDNSPELFTWKVDTSAPSSSIIAATDGKNKTMSAGGDTTSTSMTIAFSGNDTGVGLDHFECSIDGASFAVCTSPVQFNSLPDGSHTVQVRSQDRVGNKDLSPASFSWKVDTTAPTTKMDSATDGSKNAITNGGNTKSTSMTFAFSGNDTGGVGIGHFSCSTDKSEFVTCTSPFTIPQPLIDGAHTFSVMSEDKVGNKDPSPASLSWTVDTTAPSTKIDSSTDGNKSAIHNGGSTKSTLMTFAFSGNDTGGGVGIDHFSCSIDKSEFVTCTSPYKLPQSLKDGIHTFRIYSEDKVGNKDPSPASLSWTVDTAAPSSSITSVIDGNRNTVSNGGNTTSTAMTFAFSGRDTGVGLDHFECSLDGASFAVCSSPVQYRNLTDGAHSLKVLTKDKVGNVDPAPASFAWTSDTTPPTTSIDSVIDSNKNTLSNGSTTRSNSITFNFSGQDTGKVEVKRFECSLDNSEFASCSSPFSFPNLLSDGTHTFKVRAVDKSGNRDNSPELFSWNVDATPPDTSIESAKDGNNKTVSNGGNSTARSITFAFTGTDKGVGLDHFECSVDGASFTICTSPIQFNSLSDGSHTLEVRAQDKAGNEGATPIAFLWTINTKAPNTIINSVTDGNKNIVTNNSNIKSNILTFAFSATDVVANVDHFECSLDNSEFAACTTPFTFPNTLTDGHHTFKIRAVDNSGQKDPTPALYRWTVDTEAPTSSISSATDGNKTKISPDGNTPSTSITIAFSGNDTGSGVAHFECSVDGSSFTSCNSPAQYDNLASGEHNLQVRAIDNVGNQGTSIASFKWNVDATPPVASINSASDGNNNPVANGGNSTSTSITFGFSGNDTGVGLDHFECSVDGATFSTCDTPLSLSGLSIGPHSLEVSALDKVGNEGQTPAAFLWTITTPAPPVTPAPQVIPPNITTNAPTAPNITTTTHNITTTTPTPTTPAPQTIPPPNITISPTTGANQNAVTNESANKRPTTGLPPDTKIVSAVDESGNAIQDDGVTQSTSIVFVLSSPIAGLETGSAASNFECSTDGSSYSSCANPVKLDNLSDGAHIMEARAVDNSGNKDQSPASFTWTVDTVPPETIINSVFDGSNNKLTNGSDTPSTQVKLTFSGIDTGVEEGEKNGINHFECSVDDSSSTTCTSPIEYDSLANGSHTVKVIAVDNSGNKDSSPALFNWNIKVPTQGATNAANVTGTPGGITGPADTLINSITDGNGKILLNGTGTTSTTIRFDFASNAQAIDRFECSMDGSGFVDCTSPFIFPNLPEGKHVFMVRYVENNGNMDESPAAFVWSITK